MTLTEEITLADAQGKRVGWRGWTALVVLMLPVLLVSVDNTVLSFALPDISLSLNPSSAQQLWIIDAYPLVLAGLQAEGTSEVEQIHHIERGYADLVGDLRALGAEIRLREA